MERALRARSERARRSRSTPKFKMKKGGANRPCEPFSNAWKNPLRWRGAGTAGGSSFPKVGKSTKLWTTHAVMPVCANEVKHNSEGIISEANGSPTAMQQREMAKSFWFSKGWKTVAAVACPELVEGPTADPLPSSPQAPTELNRSIATQQNMGYASNFLPQKPS